MIFLSHSWQDKPAAHKVVEAFATERLPCWLDEQQLESGEELHDSLRSAIVQSDVFLYLVSDAANASECVQYELKCALAREAAGKLRVIPVRLAGNKDEMPPPLSDRVYASLDPTRGGAARLAKSIAKINGCGRIPENCRFSATVRLEEHRLVHTLAQARDSSTKGEVRILLLDDHYEALESLYWNVAEVKFPFVQGAPQELTDITRLVADIHRQSRSIIQETQLISLRFLATKSEDEYQQYFDTGHDRALRVMLHRLQWNTTYLRSLRNGGKFDDDFVAARHLPEPFDGHQCDFVSGNQKLGSVKVPEYAYPFHPHVKELVPWGLTNPFADMVQSEVGTAVGEILARRFMAQSLQSTEMPSPASLKYGLS